METCLSALLSPQRMHSVKSEVFSSKGTGDHQLEHMDTGEEAERPARSP